MHFKEVFKTPFLPYLLKKISTNIWINLGHFLNMYIALIIKKP